MPNSTEDEANYHQVVTGYLPKDDGLKLAFTGADIVVIPAGIPRQYNIGWFSNSS
jgi:malate/lactate dehydrogenase